MLQVNYDFGRTFEEQQGTGYWKNMAALNIGDLKDTGRCGGEPTFQSPTYISLEKRQAVHDLFTLGDQLAGVSTQRSLTDSFSATDILLNLSILFAYDTGVLAYNHRK